MSRDKNDHPRLADRPADYQNFGIDPVEVAQFEDGRELWSRSAAQRTRACEPPAIVPHASDAPPSERFHAYLPRSATALTA
jgi:hypothetical protein